MGGLISGPSKEELQAMDEAIAILKLEYVMLFERLCFEASWFIFWSMWFERCL